MEWPDVLWYDNGLTTMACTVLIFIFYIAAAVGVNQTNK